jgi:hypothetical protein
MSIELHYDGKVTCEFGEVAAVFGRSKTPGVVHDVAPLILVDGSRGWDDIARAVEQQERGGRAQAVAASPIGAQNPIVRAVSHGAKDAR